MLSEVDAALHFLHLPEEDLEVGKSTLFVEGAGRTPCLPRQTIPVYDGPRATPPYAVVCHPFPWEPAWYPAHPPATQAPRSWAHPHLPPPPLPLCRPKFQPPQSEGAGRGLVPLGDQETGEQTFCCPHPPQQKWGRTESRPSTPPPPHALAPSLQAVTW